MKINNYLAKDTTSIADTIQRMYENKLPLIICINKNKIVTGIFTEGDFRKAIYKGQNLKQKISKIMNKNFKFLKEKFNLNDLDKVFKNNNTMFIPVLKKGRVIKIISRENISIPKKINNEKKINYPAIIIAGGKGTRLKPFTKVLPKPLIPIKDKTVIDLLIKNFIKFGSKQVDITLGDKGKMIEAYLSNNSLPVKIKFHYESMPLGSSGSLSHFKNKLKKPFFVTNCDVVLNANYTQIMQFHKKNKNDLTIVGTLESLKVPYGVCKIDSKGELINFIEKPVYNNLASTGFYVFSPTVLNLIKKNQYLDMNHLIEKILKKKLKVSVYPIAKNNWYDLGQWEDYNQNSLKI